MNQQIVIPKADMEGEYKSIMRYLHAKYHTYPNNLLGLPVSAADQSRIGYYEKLACNIAANAQVDGNVPLGKLVI